MTNTARSCHDMSMSAHDSYDVMRHVMSLVSYDVMSHVMNHVSYDVMSHV